MDVERLTEWLIGTADEGLERPPTVSPLDQLADELGDGDTTFGGPLGGSGSDMIGKLNDHRHEAQRICRPQKDRTNFAAARR